LVIDDENCSLSIINFPLSIIMIRVLVVDDSPFVCRLLTSHLQSSSEFEVVGTALNGARAVDLVAELNPDVVTMDLEMPEMDGLEALQRIMHDHPTPVVMISGVSHRAAKITLQALEAGAVDFVLKYTPGVDTNPDALRLEILSKVRAAAKIKVVRSLRPYKEGMGWKKTAVIKPPSNGDVKTAVRPERIIPYLPGGVVVIGASTGGPVAVRRFSSSDYCGATYSCFVYACVGSATGSACCHQG